MSATASFFDDITQDYLEVGSEADFLNNYFINIVHNLDIPVNDGSMFYVYNVDTKFCFTNDLPTVPEIIKVIKGLDFHKSSCVDNISSRFCIESMLAVPEKICKMITKSLLTCVVPAEWTKCTITVLPKDGDLRNPSNWRPITQTSIFSKILEKVVHTQILKYLLETNILSQYQYGFLPQHSTQLAVFELVKQIYSSMNNKKYLVQYVWIFRKHLTV